MKAWQSRRVLDASWIHLLTDKPTPFLREAVKNYAVRFLEHPAPLQKLWDYFRLSIMIIGTLSSVHIFNANWRLIFPEAIFFFFDVHENTLDVGHMAWALHNLNLNLSSERSPTLDMLEFVPDKICPFLIFLFFLWLKAALVTWTPVSNTWRQMAQTFGRFCFYFFFKSGILYLYWLEFLIVFTGKEP